MLLKKMREFDQSSLLEILGDAGKEEVAARLDQLVQLMGERRFGQEAARQLVLFARPEIALPNSLECYAPLVREGIESFLSGISYPRLRRVLVSLFGLRHTGGEPGERLFQLALHFPTLHKLGQVIARNPHLDPQVKRWLVGLEHGNYGAEADAQVEFILDQLAKLGTPVEVIDISPLILAEASVATVLAFCCWRFADGGSGKGVFKVLKPGVQDDLREELQVLSGTFALLEQNRQRYGLQDMKLTGIFEEIREDMAREVDLTAEQAHLAEAVQVYGRVLGLRIPKLAPFNSPAMTSMEYIDGRKIGEVDMTDPERLTLARLLFEAVICAPLFMPEAQALFHGDPHAGNILVIPGEGRKGVEVALLDWTLATHLAKPQRILVMELLLGIVKNDSRTLARGIASLAAAGGEELNLAQLADRIAPLLTAKDYLACDSLKKTFLLLETMSLQGMVFPAELILFRKAFFTLEGVLHDISPGFAMGEAMEQYLAGLLLQELPQRYATSMLPVADRAEQYRTLLTNSAVRELGVHQAIGQWRLAMERNSALVDSQMRLMTELIRWCCGCSGSAA